MTRILGERRHADREVSMAEVDSRPVVTKRYTELDATIVYTAMSSLWASRFGAVRQPPGLPEPLGIRDRTITMSFIDGLALGERGNPGRSPARLDDLAQLLADLHGSGVTVARRRHPMKILRSLSRKAEGLSPLVHEQFIDALAAVTTVAPDDDAVVIGHGDFSPRNVLVDPHDHLILIDFDRLQMAGPGRDVAYLGAWIWVTELQADRTPSWEVADNFLAAYAARSGRSPAQLTATAGFHRAAALLRIAQSWTSLSVRPDQAAAVIAEARSVARRVQPRRASARMPMGSEGASPGDER